MTRKFSTGEKTAIATACAIVIFGGALSTHYAVEHVGNTKVSGIFGIWEKRIVAKEAPVVAGNTRYYLIAEDHTVVNVDISDYANTKPGDTYMASTNRWEHK